MRLPKFVNSPKSKAGKGHRIDHFRILTAGLVVHEMEANAGKSFQMQINLPALVSISC